METVDPYPVVVVRGAWAEHKEVRFAAETIVSAGVHAVPARGVAQRSGAEVGNRAAFHSEDVEGAPSADAPRASVVTTLAHLTGPLTHHALDSIFGLSGMRKLAVELRDDRTKAGWWRCAADDAAAAGEYWAGLAEG